MAYPFTDAQINTKAAAVDSAIADVEAAVADYLDAVGQMNDYWRGLQTAPGRSDVGVQHGLYSKGRNLVTSAFVKTCPTLAKVFKLRLNQQASGTLADNHPV